MTTTPSSNSCWAWGLALGRATGAIGFAATPRPGARGPQAANARTRRSGWATRLCRGDQRGPGGTQRRRLSPAEQVTWMAPGGPPFLLVTADLLDAFERDARLAQASRRAQLGLLGELVLGQARQRVVNLLRVLVVDADLQRARVARLVRVQRLVLDHHHDLLELVAVDLLLFLVEVLGHGRVAHGLGVGLVSLTDAQQRR